MNFFTMLVEVSGEGRWDALEPASTRAFEGSAGELAAEVIAQSRERAGQWRVRVWEGANADTSGAPAVEQYAR